MTVLDARAYDDLDQRRSKRVTVPTEHWTQLFERLERAMRTYVLDWAEHSVKEAAILVAAAYAAPRPKPEGPE